MAAGVVAHGSRVHVGQFQIHRHGLGQTIGGAAVGEGDAGARGEIGVPSRIDEDLGAERRESGLVANDDGREVMVGQLGRGELGVEENFPAGLGQHRFQLDLQLLAFEGRDRAAIGRCVRDVAEAGAARLEAADQFVGDAADDLFATGIVETHHGADAHRGERAAQKAVFLDEQHARAGAGGRDRRDAA